MAAKNTLCEAVPLAVPKSGEIFHVITGASNNAIGATIQQNGRPLVFCPGHSVTQRKYILHLIENSWLYIQQLNSSITCWMDLQYSSKQTTNL